MFFVFPLIITDKSLLFAKNKGGGGIIDLYEYKVLKKKENILIKKGIFFNMQKYKYYKGEV